jgi:hypothetical protein
MKEIITSKGIKILSLCLVLFGLIQAIDLPYYLMNQADTYLFNLGAVALVVVYVGIFYVVSLIGKILLTKNK